MIQLVSDLSRIHVIVKAALQKTQFQRGSVLKYVFTVERELSWSVLIRNYIKGMRGHQYGGFVNCLSKRYHLFISVGNSLCLEGLPRRVLTYLALSYTI